MDRLDADIPRCQQSLSRRRTVFSSAKAYDQSAPPSALQIQPRPGSGGKLAAAADEIGMDVRLGDLRDRQPLPAIAPLPDKA
ncbi:MAG: hypothetical protein U0703_11650 [Anaerolineae bacterium]